MIKGTFRMGGELVEAVVDKNNILFSDTSSGAITTIEGLKISKAGVIKEFPELEHDPEWRIKSIEKLKRHAKKFKTENKKLNYIKDELEKFGYEPLFKQKAGWRPQKFK